MKWVVLPFSDSYFEQTNCIEVKIDHYPIIKHTINRIAFGNTYESTIIFQSFYLPTFLPNLRLMRPFSLARVELSLLVIFINKFI